MLRVKAVFVVGEKITPFVSPWSTMTNIESNPEEVGRSVMRLQETCWNGQVVVERMGTSSGVIRWVFTLFCWHTAHLSTYFQTKEASPDHQNSVETSWQVFKTPGCPAVGWSWCLVTARHTGQILQGHRRNSCRSGYPLCMPNQSIQT